MLVEFIGSIARRRMASNTRRRAEFYRMLLLLHRNLGDLLAALRDIEANFSDDGQRPYDPTAMMAAECADLFQAGEKLSTALQAWIPEEEVMLISAGEEAGHLQNGLRRALESAQRAERIGKSLQKLIYPAAMIAGIGVLMQQVATGVVPQLVRLAKDVELPFAGKALKVIATIVNTSGYTGAAIGLAAIVATFASLPYLRGPVRLWLERFPPWSVYRDLRGASFLSQLTLLQGGGVEIGAALEQLGDLASPWLRERAEGLARGVQNGLSLGEAAYQSGYLFPAPAAIRFLRTVASHNDSARSIEEFAEDWYGYSLEKLDQIIMAVSTTGIVIFYAVILLIYAAMNDITNVMTAMPTGIK